MIRTARSCLILFILFMPLFIEAATFDSMQTSSLLPVSIEGLIGGTIAGLIIAFFLRRHRHRASATVRLPQPSELTFQKIPELIEPALIHSAIKFNDNDHVLGATLLSLAIKRCIKIVHSFEGDYLICRDHQNQKKSETVPQRMLLPMEKAVLNALFKNNPMLLLDGYSVELNSALMAMNLKMNAELIIRPIALKCFLRTGFKPVSVYTSKGRKIIGEINALMEYLTHSEPLEGVTYDLFERFVPYAVALGILDSWIRRCVAIFNEYDPVWFNDDDRQTPWEHKLLAFCHRIDACHIHPAFTGKLVEFDRLLSPR